MFYFAKSCVMCRLCMRTLCLREDKRYPQAAIFLNQIPRWDWRVKDSTRAGSGTGRSGHGKDLRLFRPPAPGRIPGIALVGRGCPGPASAGLGHGLPAPLPLPTLSFHLIGKPDFIKVQGHENRDPKSSLLPLDISAASNQGSHTPGRASARPAVCNG